MAIIAKLNHLRVSPRKVRRVADLIRGMDATDAQVSLERLGRSAAAPVLKLLRSAIASARHNFQKESANLFIKVITVDGGATLKRYRPRAMGRAADIHKHTSHITLTLDERLEPPKKKRFTVHAAQKAAAPTLEDMSQGRKKPEFSAKEEKREASKPSRFSGITKKFFRRKSV